MKNIMIKKLKVYEYVDQWDNVYHQEMVEIDENGAEQKIFYASSLSECPEDAIIGRSIFNAGEAHTLLTKALEWGKQGYTKLQVEYITETEEEINW